MAFVILNENENNEVDAHRISNKSVSAGCMHQVGYFSYFPKLRFVAFHTAFQHYLDVLNLTWSGFESSLVPSLLVGRQVDLLSFISLDHLLLK